MIRTLLATILSLCLATSALAGDDEGWAAYERADYATALEEWLPLAEKGEVAAQLSLGIMYKNGQGVAQDYAVAMEWYHQAANQGDAVARSELGVLYYHGLGTPQDYSQTQSDRTMITR
jgi:TPR repeat protein